jgi:MFS family permease
VLASARPHAARHGGLASHPLPAERRTACKGSGAVPPLWRNRDFVLLQAGQLLSTAGTSLTTIAYPLLALALTDSAAKAGLVTFARLAPFGLLTLFAGVAADRWRRKSLMIAADAARAAAMAALGSLVLAGEAVFSAILLVAFVEGAGATLFGAAEPGALRAVVPPRQLPAAAGAREARRAVVRLGGAPLGGALFGLSRALPFVVDAVSYLFSTVSLLAMRTPFEELRAREKTPLRARVREAFRFLWHHDFLRTTTLLYGIGNFLGPAMLFTVVVVGRRQGYSPGEIGALTAALGVGTLVGSLASPLFRRALTVRAILVLELWTWVGSWAFVAWPRVYVLAAALALFGVAAPVTDSVVVGYRLAITPDRLVGRVESVRSNIALIAAPVGPLAAGVLLEATSARATVASLAALGLALAIWGTLSPAIREAPRITELEAAGAR